MDDEGFGSMMIVVDLSAVILHTISPALAAHGQEKTSPLTGSSIPRNIRALQDRIISMHDPSKFVPNPLKVGYS